MNKLRNLRKEKDVLQSEVANYLGVSTTTYSNYENETRDISTEMLIKLAQCDISTTLNVYAHSVQELDKKASQVFDNL